MHVDVKTKLVCANIVTLLVILFTIGYPVDALRIVLGFPFLLFVPGYALFKALVPESKPGRTIETIAASVVLSLAVVPLVGLALNYTSWGIALTPILIGVASFTLVASAVGWFRQRAIRSGEESDAPWSLGLSITGTGWRDWMLSGLMGVTAIVAIAACVYFLGAPKRGEQFTAFYLDSVNGHPVAVGESLASGTQGTAKLTVTNHEGRDIVFRVDVVVDGLKYSQVGPVRLSPEADWQGEVPFAATSAASQKVELLLFEGEETVPHLRPLYFWINRGQ